MILEHFKKCIFILFNVPCKTNKAANTITWTIEVVF